VSPRTFINAAMRSAKRQVAVLTRDLRRDLKRGHPWVFADAVRLPAGIAPGTLVTLERDQRVVGQGYADPEGPLAIRMLTTDPKETVDAAIAQHLTAAIALRKSLFPSHEVGREGGRDGGREGGRDGGRDDGGKVSGYRVVNGEGDGLPGLVVDRYGDVLVIKTDGPIADAFWDVTALAEHLAEALGVATVYGRARSRGGAEGRPLLGAAPGLTPFREGPATLWVDVVNGQKTGYFLDQREHRIRVGTMAAGRRVLNMFGYNGGFSIQAGKGGARHVTTVDLAAPAIAEADRCWAANGLDPALHRGVTADAFAFLEAADAASYDLVVLDPPAFAPNRKSLPQALAAYQRLAGLGARVTSPGGILLLASCSAHVTMTELIGTIEEGVSAARRKADVLAIGGQPPDHPWPLACPELAYLKAVYLRIRD